MAAIDLPRADVLGWSMGGFVAQQLAIRHPDRVRRLVLAGTNPGGSRTVLGTREEQEVDSNPDPSLAEILGELYPPHEIGEGFAFAGRLVHASADGTDPERLPRRRRDHRRPGGRRGPLAAQRGQLPRARVAAIPTPRDRWPPGPVVPPPNLERIAAQVPGARLRLFAGAHAFLFQQRVAFTKVVDRFLGD